MAASARTTRPLLATSRASKRRCSTPSGVRSQPSAPITRSGPRTLTWTSPPPPTTTFWPDRPSDAPRLSVERLHKLRRGCHREHDVEVAQSGGRNAAREGGGELGVAGGRQRLAAGRGQPQGGDAGLVAGRGPGSVVA